ncbi:protein kinase [Bdellovibrio bacteriovorus]|uniref:Pkn protein n=1 Tax=Bdellovibrio bacteriovorus (strain ATCC 15356 / DSM 50701 / NCIMB 9529 / HD100) TaxID=264462 RepID=Q6MIK7_BDEBA|nr:protein kinase [Bdellovibrio bacteriovorus]AHZ83536.1 membrane protein [Bdellovibrio bacteriovorus]BEV69506.1 Serine/threonine-protein kinase PknD [Bdellovibrio bacteriovorus]CAE80906.1 pkn [Bdellovibrio bacteriovorus HD100]
MSQAVEQFGKYILLERLAAGGMAEVYLSKSTGAVGVNKFVAIKRILPQYSDHQDFIEMFKEEAKIAVNLNHGNVVSIYDFGVERAQFFLVMEYVEGRNLRQILNELKKTNTQFTIEQIVYMIKEVAAGLDHAHRCIDGTTGKPLNIVHRDMSPQNIMVSFEGEVKIIDFGIAKAETQMEATKAGTLKGKYGYMSPEQADGQSIDPRTDIFSMGIVLWELLANDRLFTSNSEAAILRKIRECQVPSIRKINPSVPPELERIVNKALAKDKSLRYQTAAAFHRDLNRFLNTQYPEFSPHDFSVFMKNAFSAAFLEQRRKLVEFAKIQSQPSSEDKTIVTQTDMRTPQRPPAYAPPAEAAEGEERLDLDTSTDIRVNLDNLKTPPKPSMPKVPGATDTNITQTRTSATGTFASGPGTMTRTPSSVSPMGTRTSIGRPAPSSSMEDITGIAMKAVGALLVVVGLWWGYTNFVAKKSPGKSGATAGLTPKPATAGNAQAAGTLQQTELAATSPEYTVTIYSNPGGARVVIDGNDTGEFTPVRKTVKANTPYSLRLVKEGYTDLVTTITPTYEAYSFTGTLQRLPRVASLIINIVNGGANPELRIAGVPVSIKPSGDAYLIQAEVGVKIQARNKTTGLSAETTITVPADQRKIVDLYLK